MERRVPSETPGVTTIRSEGEDTTKIIYTRASKWAHIIASLGDHISKRLACPPNSTPKRGYTMEKYFREVSLTTSDAEEEVTEDCLR